MKIKPQYRPNGEILGYSFMCPGCGGQHVAEVPRWNFNGDLTKPTFTPSIKVTWGKHVQPDFDESGWCASRTDFYAPSGICHFFITNGQILFCGDCTHDKKGMVMDLPDIHQNEN